jgi:hypothetical protein
MSYFRELPDLNYQSLLKTKHSSNAYIRVKNLFRRVKLRDDLQNSFTQFNKYYIPDGSRPDIVAEELYGSSDLDWVVCITAGIININNDWPLSSRDIYRFAESKYGTDLNSIHHYETTEVKDDSGRVVLPARKHVDSTFTIPKPGTDTATLNPIVGVSNYEYEVELNEKKRGIYVLRREYLRQFLNDMRTIMHYEKSSQFVNRKLVETENTRNTAP